MRLVINILIFIFSLSFLNAQKIRGKYNCETQQFKTYNKSYWIGEFDNGVAPISREGYLGLIDSMGKIILPPICDEILEIDDQIIRYFLNNKFYCLERGENNLFDTFIYIYPFYEGVAKFSKGINQTYYKDKGFITSEGKVIADLGVANGFTNFVGGITVKGSKGQITLMNKNGITKSYRTSGFDRYGAYRKEGIVKIPFFNGRKVHFVNKHFENITDTIFDVADNFRRGYTVVKHKEKWGILDSTGNLWESDYKEIKPIDNGIFIVTNQSDNYGVIDHKGNILIPIKYKRIHYLFDELFAVSIMPGSWSNPSYSVIDIYNNKIVEEWMSEKNLYIGYYSILKIPGVDIGMCFKVKSSKDLDFGVLRNGFHMYKYIGEIYFFDRKGILNDKGYEVIIESSFGTDPSPTSQILDWFGNYLNSLQLKYKCDGKFHASTYHLAFKKEGNRIQIKEFNGFKEFCPLGHNKFIFTKNNDNDQIKYGVIDIDENVLVPFIYDRLIYCKHNVLIAQKNGKWGVVDYRNKVIASFKYDSLHCFNTGLIAVKDNKYGLLDLRGKLIVPHKYDNLKQKNKYAFTAEMNKSKELIDKKGNKISN